MRNLIYALILLVFFNGSAHAMLASDLSAGDKYYNEKSYQLAETEYAKFLDDKSDEKLSREVTFKWSDSVVKGKDENNREKAEKNLQELIDGKDHDRWWAEASASLAADYVERDPYNKGENIKKWFDNARDWWAGSDDIDLARQKFISISFALADFDTSHWGWYVSDVKAIRLGGEKESAPVQGNQGLQILFEEILKIAKSDADKAHAHYGLGMSYMQNYSGDQKLRDKAIEEFKTVADDFSDTEWADDAWYQLGQYYENRGDYVKAEETYRALLKKFKTGDTQWVDDSKRRLEEIVNPSLNLSTNNTFVPDSEIRYSLNWRNVKEAEVSLYKLDLAEDTVLNKDNNGPSSYQELLKMLVESGRYANLPVQASWKQALEDDGKHVPHSEYKGMAEWRKGKDDKIDPKLGALPAGAYLMMVTAGEKKAYDLVLVSDLALVNKTAKNMALFFAMNAKTGKPSADAKISYIYSYYDTTGNTKWDAGHGTTDSNGLLKVELKDVAPRNYSQQHSIFATATAKDQQAFVQNSYYQQNYNNKGEWWLYAFSDRPAYRPNETVSFKAILRHPENGAFGNPSGMKVIARITDPQGNQVKEAHYALNAYGSFDDTLVLDEKAPLGEYRMTVSTEENNSYLAAAQLFRLEEYKLPEFVVKVHAEPKDDKEKIGAYRLGDTVNVSVDAQYYFGGPVANAQVEYLVYQQPYSHQYQPVHPYEWYYTDMYQQNYGYGGGYGQLLKTEKITTDKDGKAHFKIDTPKDSGSDLQYHVEVRVVDKSRREIRSSSDIKVTKNAFFAYLESKQNLYRPGDKAKVTIKTMTANDEPVSVEGKVSILRNTWHEAVLGDGKKVVQPGGYAGQEVVTKFVKTNDKGEAVFEFEPGENGYYAVEFTGFDQGREVKGATNVYVCDTSANNIGYRYSGLQIIAEKDTYGVGDTLRAMIVSDQPDTWVLFTTEADGIYDYQMIHLEGSVKLVEVPVKSNYTPNVYLNALSGDHYQMKTEALQIIVPPAEKFLNVKISSDKDVYQPQEEGSFDITVTDKDGKPVSGEIALGLVDASVYYIHDEYAQDIRQFFYGDKRQPGIQTQTSFQEHPYINLVRGENDELMSDDEKERRDRAKSPEGHAEPVLQEGREMDQLKQRQRFGALGGAMDKDGAYPEEKAANAVSESAPAAAPMKAMAKKEAEMGQAFNDKKGDVSGGKAGTGEAEEPVQVRNDFRSTVIWQPAVKTDGEGKATVHVKFPDSLTTWRMTARAVTADTAIGTMTHEVKSNKDLMIRLQAPRFFTERDLVDVSALIDNMSDQPITVSPVIKAEGVTITGLYRNGEFVKGEAGPIEVPAHGQGRADWAVMAKEAGKAHITVSVRSGKMADAMEKTYPVIPHGIEKFLAQSMVLKGGEGEQTKEITVNIPKERIRESTSLRLNLSPSLAANLLDALPYLADYPYGCVEQTMSRFMPAVVVAKTMRDLGISKEDVEAYISDVLEPRGDPKGHPQRRNDPTYSRLHGMTDEALKRLYDFQHADGGWGWWKTDDSDRFMTAYVLWGLGMAWQAGIEVKGDAVTRAAEYLKNQLVEEEDHPDMLAWMLHAIANTRPDADQRSDRQRKRLWDMRDKLNPYTRALFAIAEAKFGDKEHAHILAQNVINGISEDKENGTAHWGEAGINYRWSDGGVEATAFSISALSQLDPQSPYLEPAVKWMSLNRRGASWKNTRDTAIAILGLTEYLKATHELSPDYTYKVMVNGETVREGKVDASNVFSFNRIVDIDAGKLRDGENKVKIVMSGKGALYASAYAKYFTLEEPITKAGNEIFVDRHYFIQSVKETLMKGYTNDWKALKDGDMVHSGDRIRVEVTLDAKNNYEYLLAEDYKPAGLEAVELNSGAGEAVKLDKDGRETSEHTPLYQEFRDQKAAFFIGHIKQGKHLFRYELRAEIPGKFHAMPDQAHAMYVPEIRANSDEMRIDVNDATDQDSGKK